MKAVILKASSYEFDDEKTKRHITGFRLNYIPLGMVAAQNSIGVPYVLEKGCSDITKFGILTSSGVPAVYDIAFTTTYNRQGNLVERPIDFRFERPLRLEDLGITPSK